MIKIAKAITKKNYWKAIDLLAHTLIGVGQIGMRILWKDDIFIYGERKTGFLHYFKSKTLAKIPKSIGIKEGIILEHMKNPAKDIIHRLYGSYPFARRIHYLLKE